MDEDSPSGFFKPVPWMALGSATHHMSDYASRESGLPTLLQEVTRVTDECVHSEVRILKGTDGHMSLTVILL